MKSLRLLLPFLFLVFAMGTFVACQDDEPVGPDLTILRLDQENVTGPLRNAGTHRFAVRFNESRLAAYDGLNLTGIRVFVGASPQALELSAHVGGETTPAGVGERRIVAGENVPSGGFFDYSFDAPLQIDASQALWLVAEVELAQDGSQSIGCDADGDGVEGGDWIFSPSTGWGTFEEESGDNINWNIRGLVE